MLGFNLGIEAFQLLVILAAMPWLVLLARSHVYGPLRIAGPALTGIAAAAVDEMNARKQTQSTLRAGEPDAATSG